ncbi:MAG: hypothetical protein PHT07_22975 [Paludibacter sp.]|nr:hypothetical protein [Paludibacter sp.]
MKHTLFLLTVLSLMTSCATIINQPYTMFTVYTTQPSEIIFKKDTIKTTKNKANLIVERKNETLKIIAKTDSITKTIHVEPQKSTMYWANICYNYGIGMLVDRDTPKQYTYPQRIYINSTDTTGKYCSYDPSINKGSLDLHLSLPHINSFLLTPENEGTRINTGFWGLTVGLDYYHSKNQFINISASAVTDIFLPFPAAVDPGEGKQESMYSTYLSLSNNYRYKRFTIGYGLSYSRNTWEFGYYGPYDHPLPTGYPVIKSHIAYGLIFPTYFQITKYFNIGVVYRPTFYRPNMTYKFKYEHLISIDFAWKIRLINN